ncbi:MAG: phage tail tape measure protein, partial [Lactobacillus johnsonii]|nr:phage tail tape measure protein [Lactobacillus johnsonii]
MAKRNQVTADLRISANAQLKNSQSFIKELERITSGFDFGNKINNQLEIAKGQLKEYNKVLSKVQNKSVVSDEELKDIVKAGKEIASLVTKTQSLYKNLNGGDLKKYSREYIAETKRIEQTVAKIKQDYADKTGKNFDKELANYDKLLAKNKELKKQREQIAKSGVEELVTKQIEQTTQKLEQQKKKLEEIKALREQSSKTYSNTLNQEAIKRGYKDYNDLNSRKVLNEDQIKKNIGTNIYKQERQELTAISKELKNIESIKDNVEAQNKKAISLAAKYNIENVKDLNTFKAQLKVKQDLLNTYKNDKSKLALRNQELITEEIRKQNQLAKDKAEVKDVAKTAELNVINAGGYSSKASLSASYATTNKSVNNLGSQLTESGIEAITNSATAQIKSILQKIDNDIIKSNSELNNINDTNNKLATQSERAADEQDVKEGANKQIAATNADGEKTRNEFKESFNGLTESDKKQISESTLPKGNRFSSMASEMIYPAGGAVSLEDLNSSATYKTALNYDTKMAGIDNLKSKLATVNKEGQTKILQDLIISLEKLDETGDTLLRNSLMEHEKNVKAAIEELNSYKIKNSPKDNPRYKVKYRDRVEELKTFINNAPKDEQLIRGAHSTAKEELQSERNRLINLNDGISNINPQNIKDASNSMDDLSNKAAKGAKQLSKAAEQASYIGSAFDDIKNKVGYFLSLNYVFDQMTRKIGEANQYIKDLDKDMTQIGLVLGKTASQTWKNFDSYTQMADRLSTTTSDVTAAMKLFYQQGLNTVEVNKMVEASAIAAALGESTMAEASETLTSIMNSYGLSASQAIDVTDKISQVAIVSAADFGEISTAIEKVASSAASAGLDLDHLMGYLGKMIETTREAPTNVGTALKTIVANFAQFKEDPNATTEDGTDMNKVDKALKTVGIQLLDTNGEMRDLGEVIDELGIKWKDLSRNTKSYLATVIAGTRQQSRFYALMNDYDRTLELVNESSQSSGKATEQFSIYQDSLTASTQRLQNQWEKFYKTTLDGDSVLKNLNNALTTVLKAVNKIGPVWTAIFGVLGTKSIKDLLNWINRLNEGIRNVRENNLSLEGFTNNFIKNGSQVNSVQQQKYSLVPGANWIGQKVASFGSNQKKLPDTIKDYENLITVQKNLEKQQGILSEQDKLLIEGLNNKELATKLNTAATNGDATAAIGDAVATTGEKVAKDAAAASTWGLYAAQVALTMGVALLGLAISGIVSGIIGGIVVGAFSGNSLQVSGPAAGLILIIVDIMQTMGVEKLFLIIFIVGLLQITFGLFSFG